jgi:NAD(P)-dependent dehydrogenase (short-subunit alcohol dehydrogenase family)
MAERARRSLRDLGDLSGRRAVVAGGSGHLGRAAVEALQEAGARVAVLDVAPSDVEIAIACDLADEAGARAGLREAAERLGGLDVLVHAAALVGTRERDGWAVPFNEQTVAAWDAALRVNVTSLFALVQEARASLVASCHASVIALASIYGVVGPDPSLYDGTELANPTAYGVSKGGMLQLVRYLATILAPHVRVNAISPGGVERGQPREFVDRYRARTPLARMATEEDIKGAVAFLASDLSSYVTGHNLVVDGGWTAW